MKEKTSTAPELHTGGFNSFQTDSIPVFAPEQERIILKLVARRSHASGFVRKPTVPNLRGAVTRVKLTVD